MSSIGKIITFLISVTISLIQMSKAGTIVPSASATRNIFATELFKQLAPGRVNENMVFSPTSIQSSLVLAYLGAEGETEKEMRSALVLGVADKRDIARNFGEFIKTAFKRTENGPQLTMANRIYVNEGLKIAPAYAEVAKEYFNTAPQHVRFADAATAVKEINDWVEKQTENKIQNLLQPSALGGSTSAMLVNAIYFKALWQHPFSQLSTHKADFALRANEKVSVDMMYNDEKLRYASLPELNATALELPYINSDLSMLLVLPNKVDGLSTLESELAKMDLHQITDKMQKEDVEVFLPKFRIETDVDLKEPVQKLGMTRMFSNEADFSSLFADNSSQAISEIRHKAYLDVNEAGSEAAAATFLKIVPMSLNLGQKIFRADHPFYFAIRSPTAIYFAGHITHF